MGEVHIYLFIIKLKNRFLLFNIKLNNYFTLFFNVINNLYIPGKRRNHRNARVAVAVVKLAAEAQRGIIRHTDEHDLTQGAIPQLRVWDVHLAEEATRHRSMPSLTQLTVSTVSSFILPFPKR